MSSLDMQVCGFFCDEVDSTSYPLLRVWHACYDVSQILEMNPLQVNWSSSVEGLILDLKRQTPDLEPNFGFVVNSPLSDRVSEFQEPVISSSTGSWQNLDLEQVNRLARARRRVYVHGGFDSGSLVKKYPDLYLTSAGVVCYDPKHQEKLAARRLKKCVTMVEIEEISINLLRILPTGSSEFQPLLRQWLLDSPTSSTLHKTLIRFLATWGILEKLVGRRKLRKSEDLRKFLDQWSQNRLRNRAKFSMRNSKDGVQAEYPIGQAFVSLIEGLLPPSS